MYGGTYGGSSSSVSYRPQLDYWGLRNEIKRKDGPQHFNYFELGPVEENSVHNRYGGPMSGGFGGHHSSGGYGGGPVSSVGYGGGSASSGGYVGGPISSGGFGERPQYPQGSGSPSSGGYGERPQYPQGAGAGMNWGQMWTRRPGVEGEKTR